MANLQILQEARYCKPIAWDVRNQIICNMKMSRTFVSSFLLSGWNIKRRKEMVFFHYENVPFWPGQCHMHLIHWNRDHILNRGKLQAGLGELEAFFEAFLKLLQRANIPANSYHALFKGVGLKLQRAELGWEVYLLCLCFCQRLLLHLRLSLLLDGTCETAIEEDHQEPPGTLDPLRSRLTQIKSWFMWRAAFAAAAVWAGELQ